MNHFTAISTLLLSLVLGTSAAAQNPYVRAGANIGVLADLRARNIGDILTVTIQEQHSVKNEEKVQRSNDTSLAARVEAFTLSEKTFLSNTLPKVDIRKESDFNGEAKQNSGSEVRASIAVVVIDVQPNGNLVIAGTRSVTVNDETRTLRISGLVRPLDVTPNNTVGSAQVADARISISGEGANTRQVTRGPIGQLFDTLVWVAWPF
ncbi:MAG: flagellar basal body L-ring protein FlgH [Planctomycetes bacterium]|jgi:flagellar L-ring protein precursor FlgH|nr:flagellar basal body L-ring protein FlgH [Planctomycetota bacterium]